jgi:hypothetical protein
LFDEICQRFRQPQPRIAQRSGVRVPSMRKRRRKSHACR